MLAHCVHCVLVGGQFRVEVVIWTNSIFDAVCMDRGPLRLAVAPMLHTLLAWRDLSAGGLTLVSQRLLGSDRPLATSTSDVLSLCGDVVRCWGGWHVNVIGAADCG